MMQRKDFHQRGGGEYRWQKSRPYHVALEDSYSVENGLWCPDQNRGGEVFNLPPMPFGCTDYTQADVCADDDQELKNPLLLENVIRRYKMGGIGVFGGRKG